MPMPFGPVLAPPTLRLARLPLPRLTPMEYWSSSRQLKGGVPVVRTPTAHAGQLEWWRASERRFIGLTGD